MVIACVAIVHVFIAHFAVGAGILNAVLETCSLRRGEPSVRNFLRDNSKLIVLLPLIGGVVTGVGIWFSIALVSPETTATLIRLFVWAWAIEWVLFLVEIISGYVYYYTWDSMSARRHCFIGWIYAISAAGSLVVINGILTFMITPSAGFDSSARPMVFEFWSGWLNPVYWPSLIMRGIAALGLAGLFAMLLVNASRKYSQADRDRVVQLAAKFLLPMVLTVPAAVWYFAECPRLSLSYLAGGSVVIGMLFAISVVMAGLIGLYGWWVVIGKRSVSLEAAALLLVLAFMAMGASEFVREGMRKPYLIWGHVYSNGIVRSDMARMQGVLDEEHKLRKKALRAGDRYDGPVINDTALRFFPWAVRPVDVEAIAVIGDVDGDDVGLSRGLAERYLVGGLSGADRVHIDDDAFYTTDPCVFANALRESWDGRVIRGRWLYDAQCRRCHCIDGYNAVRPLVRNWSPDMINKALRELELLRGFMPAFVGSARDREDVASYMHELQGSCSHCHGNIDDDGKRQNSEPIKKQMKDWEPLP